MKFAQYLGKNNNKKMNSVCELRCQVSALRLNFSFSVIYYNGFFDVPRLHGATYSDGGGHEGDGWRKLVAVPGVVRR